MSKLITTALLALVALICTESLAQHTDAQARADLAAALRSIIDRPELSGATVGVHVVRLTDGVELFSHQPDALLVPASNVKLVTTAAALHYLGPDYRFKTQLFGEIDAHGVIEGSLYLKGFGDPYLVPERVWYLANRLRFAGVTELRGGIVVDDSYFDSVREPNGRGQDRSSYSYMAPSGAVSVGFNAILVHVAPADQAGTDAVVRIEPLSAYPILRGRVRTTRRSRTSLGISVEPYRDRSIVRVSGRIQQSDAPRAYWRRIDNPPVFAGELLRETLRQVGIAVQGEVREGAAPEDAPVLATTSSPRLAELVGRLNRHSNNFMAAQVARTMGAEIYGPPGSWQKASRALGSFLEGVVGIEPDTYQIGNASGLHDVNRLTARQIVQLLQYMEAQPDLWPEFAVSMAVAGGSGTLQDRMLDSEAQRLLRAKTGTLRSVSALSGYVPAGSGEKVAFSFLVNDHRCPVEAVWQVQDELGAALAAVSFAEPTPGEGTAISSFLSADAPQHVESGGTKNMTERTTRAGSP